MNTKQKLQLHSKRRLRIALIFIIALLLGIGLTSFPLRKGYADTGLTYNPGNGHWYQRIDTPMLWHDARDHCESLGGHLVTITSSSENNFVYHFFSWGWLGATDELQEGVWQWVNGEAWNYTNWAPNEPNNQNDVEHYLNFKPENPADWNDINNGEDSFICEWENMNSFSGYVTEQGSGDPIPNAEVCATDFYSNDFFGCVQTEWDGFYIFGGLPDGDYEVDVFFSGYAWQWYDGQAIRGNADPVNVQQSQNTPGIDFALGPGGIIEGHVYQDDGQTPIANIFVELEGHGMGSGTCTDVNGYYRIDTIPYGTEWRVEAAEAGNDSCGGPDHYITQYYDGVYDGDSATVLTVDANTPTHSGIDFSLSEGGSFSGLVTEQSTGNPVENADVCVHEFHSGDHIGCTQTGQDGTYTFGGLLTVDYRVDVNTSGYAWQYYDGRLNWGNADPVSVTAGQDTPNIDFALEPGGFIEGYVYESDGQTPIADMNVALDGLGIGEGTCTGADGYYRLGGVAYDIEWRVRAAPEGGNWCGGPEGYKETFWDNVYSWDDATPIVLDEQTPNVSGIDISLVLDAPGSIAGLVIEEGGSPLDDVDVCAYTDYDQSQAGCTVTSGGGVYQIDDLESGQYYVQASSPGWASEYYDDSGSVNNATLVQVNPTQVTENVDFALDPAGLIMGVVYGPDGVTPLSGAYVVVEDVSVSGVSLQSVSIDSEQQNLFGDGLSAQAIDGVWETYTDENGFYELQVPGGEYRVWAGYDVNTGGFSREYYDNAIAENASPVTVIVDQPTADVNFLLDTPKLAATFENYTFNMDDPLLSELAVRQAIALGTDRQRLLDEAWLVHGEYGEILDTYAPPGHWGQAVGGGVVPYPYDPPGAKGILDAAGWVDSDQDGIRDRGGQPLVVNFKTSDSPSRVSSAAIFAENMVAIGIDVVVEILPWDDFVDQVWNQRDFGIAEFAWITDCRDQNNDECLPADIWEAGSDVNAGNYNNPVADAEIDAARAESTRAGKLPHVIAHQEIITQDLPVFPLFTRESADAPVLVSPADGNTVEDTPTLIWGPVDHAEWYYVQIGPSGDLGSAGTQSAWVQTAAACNGSLCTYTSPALNDGDYDWHVRAVAGEHGDSIWSQTWGFTVQSNCASLYFEPGQADVFLNQTVTVDLMISDVADLYGAQLEISFDPTKAQVVDDDSGTAGVQITPGACPYPDFVAQNSVDNTTGTISYSASSINPSLPCDGSGVVASITFESIGEGTYLMAFISNLLSDTNGDPICVATSDGFLNNMPSCTFSGTIDLQSRTDDSGATFTAESTSGNLFSATTDASGSYELIVPPDTYTITAEMDLFLDGERAQTLHCLGNVSEQIPDVTLLGGDANDDCQINILDLAFIGARFGTSTGDPGFDSQSDVNADGSVNILDLTVAGANFLKECPVPWEGVTRQGAWVDTVRFVEEPDADNAVTRLEAGDLDVYAFSISNLAIANRVYAAEELDYYTSYGSFNELTFNPVLILDDGSLNPFGDPQIREAMNWLVDRDYITQDIMGSMARPRYIDINYASADRARMADVITEMELTYAYDFAQAEAVITARMLELGAVNVGGVWHYDGDPVEIIGLIRVEDERLEIGDYVADQLEALGFTVVRDYKTSAEASTCWISSDPATGCFSYYTGGWVSTVISRDEAANFATFYTPLGWGIPLWQAYDPAPEFYELAEDLMNREFSSLEERRQMMADVIPLSMEDSVRVWLHDSIGIAPLRDNLSVASDLSGSIFGSTLWSHTLKYDDQIGGEVTIAVRSMLDTAWNPVAGTNWVYDMMPMRGLKGNAVVPDPYTGLNFPCRLESATVYAETGLPIGVTYDWVDLVFEPEIIVPDDAWADWDAVNQVWITALEHFGGPTTAKTKVVMTYEDGFPANTTWHDGSPFTVADMVMGMIMNFDRAKAASPIYDESAVGAFDGFMSNFKGWRIVSEDPVTIEYYTDAYELDAENNVSNFRAAFPNEGGLYDQGSAAWHNIVPAWLGEVSGQMAFSGDKANSLGVDQISYLPGPTLGDMETHLQVALAGGFIPYQPTLGAYITAGEATARYENLQAWYDLTGHMYLGTGVFYLQDANPGEGTLLLHRNPDYPDLADRYDQFGEAPIPNVALNGPTDVTIGDVVTYDVFVDFKGAPYPNADLDMVTYLMVDSTGTVALTGDAVAVDEGHYQVTLDTTSLPVGLNELKVVTVSKRAVLPVEEAFEFSTTE